MDETLCKRCVRCCWFEADGKLRKCKFLVQIGTKSSCRIYNAKNRLGKVIFTMKDGTQVRCMGRLESNRIIKGFDCPYNALVIEKLNKEGLIQKKVINDVECV